MSSPKNFPIKYEAASFLNPFFNFFEKGKLKIPKYLSAEAKKCLLKMLNR